MSSCLFDYKLKDIACIKFEFFIHLSDIVKSSFTIYLSVVWILFLANMVFCLHIKSWYLFILNMRLFVRIKRWMSSTCFLKYYYFRNCESVVDPNVLCDLKTRLLAFTPWFLLRLFNLVRSLWVAYFRCISVCCRSKN